MTAKTMAPSPPATQKERVPIRPDPESDALHVRARAVIDAFVRGASSPESFDALAVDLARFQASRIPGLARLARARGTDLATVTLASEVPAVPTDAFKHARVSTFASEDARVVFRTSGTTTSARGSHAFRELGTYDAGALAFGRTMLFAGLAEPPDVVVLAPPPHEAADSSLGHMMARFVSDLCAPTTARTHFVEGDRLLATELRARLERLAGSAERPVLVLGTSFAFVHWRDADPDFTVVLPPGSRLMQTGGTKGKSREVSASTLRTELAVALGIPSRAIVSEYGMTELSSPFFEGTLRFPELDEGVHVEPPWARVVPVDPETLLPVPDGVVGLARIEDLANVDSAFAVQTQDRVVRVDAGFRLLGRAPGAPPRGCSIAIDEILSGRVP
jgi:hypothetical protein